MLGLLGVTLVKILFVDLAGAAGLSDSVLCDGGGDAAVRVVRVSPAGNGPGGVKYFLRGDAMA